MTFTLGWNIIPILITVFSIVVVCMVEREERGRMFGGIGCVISALL